MTKDQVAKFYTEAGIAMERARIRRLIGPALRRLRKTRDNCGGGVNCACLALYDIEAATRPEAKRKKGTS